MSDAQSISADPPEAVLWPGWVTRPTIASQALVSSTFVLLWVLTEWLTQHFLTAPNVSGWYPPAGLGVAMVWAFGWRHVPAVLLAAFIGQVVLWSPEHPFTAQAIAAGGSSALTKVSIYVVVGLLLRAILPPLSRMRRPSQAALAVLLLLTGAVATGMSGIGVKALWGDSYGTSFLFAAMGWAVGDAIGLLITAPLAVRVVLPAMCRWPQLLGKAGRARRHDLPQVPGEVLRPLGWGIVMAAAMAGLYLWPTTRDLNVMYIGFVAVPLIAMAYGLSGGLIAVTIVSLLGLLAVCCFQPTFDILFEMQLMMIAMSVSAVMIGAISTLRTREEQAASRERRWTALALRGGGLGRWQWEVGTTRLTSDYMLTDRLGYKREEVLQDSRWWQARIHPDDEQARRDSLQRCLSGETEYHDAETRILDAHGNWVWYHTQGKVIAVDSAGLPTLLAGTHQEITERKRMAELEREAESSQRSEKRFRAMADASPVGVFQTDPHGAFMYVNPAWSKTTGLEMSKALYRHAPAFAHVDDRDTVADHWATATKLGITMRCEMRLHRTDDTTRWVSMQASPITQDDGQLSGYVGTVVDITAYRERVAMIEDSEARYRTLAEHANDMLWRVSADTAVFTYVSPSVEALLGYPPKAMVGTSAYDYFDPSDVDRVREKQSAMTPEDPQFDDTHRYRRADGSYIVFDAIGRLVVPDEPDEPAYIVGISRDVTRRAEAEQQREALEQRLLQSQKLDALGRFARGIAHDFRNTLYAINASAQSAAKQIEPNHPAHRPLQIVQDACQQASEITQSLLTFARGQGAKQEKIDLARIVMESTRLLDALLTERTRVQCETPTPSSVWIKGNQAELEQVLMNLTTNARDAMPEGGTIHVRLKLEDDQAILEVADTGEGMTQDVADRALDPFFTTKTRLKGTGLGLALVHGIIENHGGTVVLQSKPGEGTTVTLKFPMLADQSDPVDEELDPPNPLPFPKASAS
ncbi:MAG: PAS domain S-box protein [Phycisphaerales bacterium JB063]